MYTSFKNYEWSTKATLISGIGAFFKAVGSMGIILGITELIECKGYLNVPLVIIVSMILGIIGIVIQIKADNVADKEWVLKVTEDIEFAKREGFNKPEFKEYIMELNEEYNYYVTYGNEELEKYHRIELEKEEEKKKKDYIALAVILSICIPIIILVVFLNGGIPL